MVGDRLVSWLQRYDTEIKPKLFHEICGALCQDMNSQVACWSILYDYERGKIDDPTLTSSLCLLSGKTPEELGEILRNLVVKP